MSRGYFVRGYFVWGYFVQDPFTLDSQLPTKFNLGQSVGVMDVWNLLEMLLDT